MSITNAFRIALRKASELVYDDSVTDFGLDPEDLNVQKAIEAVAQQVASITVTQSDVRQTVNTGPVDSNGRAGFLTAGSGLQVVTTGVSGSTPLNITFGDGFDANGKRDVVVVIESSLSWGSLPDNEDDISLFIRVDRDTGAVTTEASLLAPIYSAAEPSAPATGQKWYPTDHRLPMREWDGAAWNADDLIICVGQCSTSSGSVVEVRSYAYQSKNTITHQGSTSVLFAHNIGLIFEQLAIVSFKGRLRSNSGVLVPGDVVDFGNTHDMASTTRNMAFVSRAADDNLRNAIRLFGRNETFHVDGESSSTSTSFSNFDFIIEIQRSF